MPTTGSATTRGYGRPAPASGSWRSSSSKRETFAYPCEAYGWIVEHGRTRGNLDRAGPGVCGMRRFVSATKTPRREPVSSIVGEACEARENGWKVILRRCAASKTTRRDVLARLTQGSRIGVASMVVFRATQKLRRRMGLLAAPRENGSAKSSGRLGDWYANAVSVRGQQLVLGVSGITLLPVLMPAAPYKTMMPRFAQATGDILRALGIREAQVVAEAEVMRDLVVAPSTNNRRVLGSMNDFAWMMEALSRRAHADASRGGAQAGGVAVQPARDEEPARGHADALLGADASPRQSG